MKTPNWLFGQRKLEETANTPPPETTKTGLQGEAKSANVLYDLSCLSSLSDVDEESIFQRYTTY